MLVETCVILERKESGWEETAGNLAEDADQEPRIDRMSIRRGGIYKDIFYNTYPTYQIFQKSIYNFSLLQNDRFEFHIMYLYVNIVEINWYLHAKLL